MIQTFTSFRGARLSPDPRRTLSRRSLLAAAFLAAGCGRKRANRYPGWMFVSSASERSVAVADLSEFRRIGAVSTAATPCSMLRTSTGVSVICTDPSVVLGLDPDRLEIVSRLPLPARPLSALASGEGPIAILATEPDCLIIASPDLRRVLGRLPLPGRGESMDVLNDRAAVSIHSSRAIVRVSFPDCRLIGVSTPGTGGAPLRFRRDGTELLAGDAAAREIVASDWSTGALLARLPVPIEPRHFCFTENDNGGQMFVTGPGGDVVAIVAPYQNEVYETIPAGRQPGPMTVSVSSNGNLLLVANPSTGDITILDIDSRQLAASVHVGDTPRQILVTPDGEYALVVNSGSGSIAVIRLSTALNRGENALTARLIKPLFTVFPMTTSPQSALIVPHAA